MGMKSSGGGEIVQVEGGHIIRSTGRKDRHSKVYTAKGPRDRRVRLSAHTAIQFYDVQDRLGYDRPSKAVDWLINKAKNAIDKLEELPPWNPMDTTMVAPNQGSSGIALEHQSEPSSAYPFQVPNNPIDDTMKSFFPTRSETNFQNYSGDIMSRGSIQTNDPQDLCLSLHSLQQDLNSSHAPPAGLYSGPAPVTFEQQNYPRIVGWDGEIKTGFFFNSQSSQMLGQNSTLFSQRESLQSSFSPFARAWNNQALPASDHHNNSEAIHQMSISNSQFGSERFSGFQVPARIHGEDPSSASTNTHH